MVWRASRIGVAMVAMTAVACGSAGTAMPVYAPSPDVLEDAPWPSDDRLVDGTLDLTGFPNPDGIGLLDEYLAVADALPGWGPSSPIYVPFETLPDESLLPSPTESVDPESGLLLVNLEPDSPDYATAVPVWWERLSPGRLTANPTLAVAPLPGFPLRGGETHALIVTRELAAVNETFAERLADDGDPGLAPLRDALPDLDLRRRDVAVATVFTTRDPLDEMDRMVDHLRGLPAPTLSQEVTEKARYAGFQVFDGTVEAPLWQHGRIPYASSGGGFQFDSDGAPVPAETLSLRLAISTPLDLDSAPPDGFPVVLYAHGTGGEYDTFANGGSGLEPASLMARAGLVGIGFDQPLHGPRGTSGTDVDLHSFNYLNPESARANFRQGALDIVWLVHALRQGDVVFTTPDGQTIPIDSDRILYQGHSHGGLTGAIAGPWLGGHVRGAVLSGAGAGLAITVVKRKDPVDIAELVGNVIGLGPGETLTPLHPVVGLVQTLAEETDPVNYAPFFHAVDGGYSDAPLPVLLTSGQFDLQTDHETAEALAAAARLPPVAPTWNLTEGLQLRGFGAPIDSPAQDAGLAWDGAGIGSGFSQWEDGDHFVIFRDGDAGTMVQTYLRTAAEGAPIIDTGR